MEGYEALIESKDREKSNYGIEEENEFSELPCTGESCFKMSANPATRKLKFKMTPRVGRCHSTYRRIGKDEQINIKGRPRKVRFHLRQKKRWTFRLSRIRIARPLILLQRLKDGYASLLRKYGSMIFNPQSDLPSFYQPYYL